MKTEVISTAYGDGVRMDTVVYKYTIADDYIRLGQLYFNLGTQMAKGEDATLTESMIKAQHEIIKGYGDANAADTSAE